MRRPESPCLNCTTETGRCAEPNCHMTCEKFLEFDMQNKRLRNEKIKTARENEDQYRIEARRKMLVATGRMYRRRYYGKTRNNKDR